MSIQAVAWVLDQRLPPKPKLVLLAIANHANHVTGYCWLRMDTIARESSVPVRSLRRHIGALVRNGFLRKELVRGTDGKHRATNYWILRDRPDAEWRWSTSASDDDEESTQEGGQPSDSPSAILADGCADPDALEMADGPSAIGVRPQTLLEPSESKPKEESSNVRAYRPRNGEPMAAVVDGHDGPVLFVYKGTRAWDEHVAAIKRRTGRTWTMTYRRKIEGLGWREGWNFATMFPISDPDEAGERRA